MVRNIKKRGRVETGNPEFGHVEEILACYNPTRGVEQRRFGIATRNNTVVFLRLKIDRSGWEIIHTIP